MLHWMPTQILPTSRTCKLLNFKFSNNFNLQQHNQAQNQLKKETNLFPFWSACFWKLNDSKHRGLGFQNQIVDDSDSKLLEFEHLFWSDLNLTTKIRYRLKGDCNFQSISTKFQIKNIKCQLKDQKCWHWSWLKDWESWI